MDKRHLSKLRKVADKVVRHANRPGGPLDKGEFTMGMARGEICDEMGFEPGELDSKEWKKVVKGIVEEVLVSALYPVDRFYPLRTERVMGED